MKIPKYILKIVMDIEKLGSKLNKKERKLYAWLDKNHLDYDAYNYNNKDNLDTYLHNLFTFNDGKGLIQKIESIERK